MQNQWSSVSLIPLQPPTRPTSTFTPARYIRKRALCSRKRAIYIRQRGQYTRKGDQYFCQMRNQWSGVSLIPLPPPTRPTSTVTPARYVRKRALYSCRRAIYIRQRGQYTPKRDQYFWAIYITKKTNIPAKETNISAKCEIISLSYHLFLTHLPHGQLPLSRQPGMSAKEPYIAAKKPYISAKEMRPIFVLNTNVFYCQGPAEIPYVRKRGQYIRKRDQYNRKRDMCICKTEKDPHTLTLVRQVEIL